MATAITDPEALAALGELPPEDLEALLALYFEDAGLQLRTAIGAFDSGEAAGVATAAHRIKGASLSIGAALVATLAAGLEVDARAGDLSRAAATLAELDAALALTDRTMRPQQTGADAQPSEPVGGVPAGGGEWGLRAPHAPGV